MEKPMKNFVELSDFDLNFSIFDNGIKKTLEDFVLKCKQDFVLKCKLTRKQDQTKKRIKII